MVILHLDANKFLVHGGGVVEVTVLRFRHYAKPSLFFKSPKTLYDDGKDEMPL